MRDADIALAQRLADVAGEAIRPLFRAAFAVESKGDASPVTEADRAAEAAMRRLIEAEAPRDGIIGEEYGEKPSQSGRHWVLDPIDGTLSFMAGRPTFGVLIALLEDGWPVLGVIDQPIARERWVGATGRATTLNGKPARTRACREIAGAALATTSPHYFSEAQGDAFVRLAAATGAKSPLYGGDCYSYALLASGHLDIVVEAQCQLHDFAALVPVVEGAGGMMCDWSGQPINRDSDGSLIALGDPARLDDVLEILA